MEIKNIWNYQLGLVEDDTPGLLKHPLKSEFFKTSPLKMEKPWKFMASFQNITFQGIFARFLAGYLGSGHTPAIPPESLVWKGAESSSTMFSGVQPVGSHGRRIVYGEAGYIYNYHQNSS